MIVKMCLIVQEKENAFLSKEAIYNLFLNVSAEPMKGFTGALDVNIFINPSQSDITQWVSMAGNSKDRIIICSCLISGLN